MAATGLKPAGQPVAGTLAPAAANKRSRAPFLPAAAQPEIIRANQKDLYYLGELGEQVEDAARSLFGTRWLQVWGHEVSVFSRTAYFTLTTLLGSQTLGEEYCDILQYNASDRRVPSSRRRAILVFLHVLAPYVCARVYTDWRKRMRERRQAHQREMAALADQEAASEPWWSRIEWPAWEQIFDEQFMAVHLAVFYLTGRYYHAAKRAMGVRYLSSQSSSALSGSQPPSYEILGLLMAIQLGVRLILAIRAAAPAPELTVAAPREKDKVVEKRRKPLVDGVAVEKLLFDPENPSAREEEEEDPNAPYDPTVQARRCTLCLNTRLDPTATECGHVFCWECIVGWAREKAECPLCRQSIGSLSALLPVHNL